MEEGKDKSMKWMKWMRRQPKTTITQGLVGIHFAPEGISMACHVDMKDQERPFIKAVFFNETRTDLEKSQLLRKFVVDNQLEKMNCNVVLTNKDYSLTLVDRPNVDPKEMNQALQWLVRESIDFPIEEAVLDSFEVPLPRVRDNTKVSYIAVIRRSLLQPIQSLISQAGLILKYIDIPELALRNLVVQSPNGSQGQLLVYLNATGGKLMICREGNIYLIRNVDLNLAALEIGKPESDASSTLEEVALEIQRSLDFCQSYFRQPIVGSILLLPTLLHVELILRSLKSSLGVEINHLDLTKHLNFQQPITQPELANNLLAIGAGLRETVREEPVVRDTASQSLSA